MEEKSSELKPKVFISYSWSSRAHEDRVMYLAERLINSGIDVVIDKWDLKAGHDLNNFMETMVKSPDIDKVLILLDKKYAEKAEKRSGGVGTETQIISPKVYNDVSQEKFIPIIFEKDEQGNPFVPTYLAGRVYVDLSQEEHFEEKFEELIRIIVRRPASSKPPLGQLPSYLFDENPMTKKTSFIIRGFDQQINNHPKRINTLMREFFNEYFDNLKSYSLKSSDRDYFALGKQIIDNVNSYKPLLNDYTIFIDKITKIEIDFDITIVIGFFEKLPLLLRPLDDRSSWSGLEFDNYKFIIHELFLYTIAIGLKNENFKFIEELFYSSYFFQDKFNIQKEPAGFEKLYLHIDSIDEYYKRAYSTHFFSPMADLIIKRIPEGMSKDDIANADILCYYVVVLQNKSFDWFPITYAYRNHEYKFELFDRLISLRHFEKVKVLFNVNTPQELKDKLITIQKKDTNPSRIGYSSSRDRVLPIYKAIDIERIGTLR